MVYLLFYSPSLRVIKTNVNLLLFNLEIEGVETIISSEFRLWTHGLVCCLLSQINFAHCGIVACTQTCNLLVSYHYLICWPLHRFEFVYFINDVCFLTFLLYFICTRICNTYTDVHVLIYYSKSFTFYMLKIKSLLFPLNHEAPCGDCLRKEVLASKA